ncbi:PKD domain-containing protein [Candidatus Poribacteria bacterium]
MKKGMKGKIGALILSALALNLIATATMGGLRITTDPASQRAPVIYGDKIVWHDKRDEDIYMYDLSTGMETQITTGPEGQQVPAIYGDKIVWEDSRSNWDIYMYDLSTGTEIRITTDPASQYSPAIYEDKIIWEDNRNEGRGDIYMYDLSTGTETRITTDPAHQIEPAIYGDKIVWQERQNINDNRYDIYMYDLSTGTETRITTDPANQRAPIIYEDKIVWEDMKNGNWDIYMYDLSTGTETQITTDPANQDRPAIYGDKIVWHDDRNGNVDIYMYDLSAGTETQITTNTATQRNPAIYGDRIVWYDNRNGNWDIYMYDLNNIAPTVGEISAPLEPIPVGTTIDASADFTDSNVSDTHVAAWYWGDDSASLGTVDEAGGSGSVTGDHIYTSAGVHTIKLTVTDDYGDSGSSVFQYVVVYDPTGGFVTGGGWINSPPGAYIPDPSLTDRAHFGFFSKYGNGATIPTGQTQFRFKAGDLKFKSDSYEWLVVAGHKAQYKGVGTINDEGDYGFKLFAIDEALTPSTDVDLFRIKIWDKVTDEDVYDNQLGADEDDDLTTEIGGGNINIQGGGPAAPAKPSEFALLQNYPNSFNPETWIPYRLAEDVAPAIRIYDVTGHLIRILDMGRKPAGFYTTKDKAAYWNGRNEAGEQVSSGIYFYTIQAGDFTATRKMIVAR